MRKITGLLLTFIIVMAAVPSMVFANTATASEVLDKSKLDKGSIGINYEVKKDTLTKVKITKAGAAYTYTLDQLAEKKTVWFSLQMGDGIYEIAVFENVTGNQYRTIVSDKVEVKVVNGPDVFLNAVQNLNWMDADKAIAKAKELTKSSKTDDEKVKAIYNYIVSNVRYDTELAKIVKTDYIPNINDTLATGKGICYGYATLFAAMLRSEGIPTKLLMGTAEAVSEYHAWNEVYVGGKWIVVDTTVDAGLKKGLAKDSIAKKAIDYKAIKTY
ncbi:transglutaminase family protein [Cohnella sp. WQ 127256]|uniref:transglutaminase-like domain-containing protein n=1 Tax=Cohnella sp. WQ 127256 TaxID=2938790 RepID=UPI002118F064|nr:transglutaminase-like domain-containing protein [Cohnella sp. WQ 127256]